MDPLGRNAAGETPLHRLRFPPPASAEVSRWLAQAPPAVTPSNDNAAVVFPASSRPPGTHEQPHTPPGGGAGTVDAAGDVAGSPSQTFPPLGLLRAGLLLADAAGVTAMEVLCKGCYARFRVATQCGRGRLCSEGARSGAREGAAGARDAAAPVGGGSAGRSVGELSVASVGVTLGQPGDVARSRHACVCRGAVWEAAGEESAPICMLLVPDGLRAPSRAGGVLGTLRCRGAGTCIGPPAEAGHAASPGADASAGAGAGGVARPGEEGGSSFAEGDGERRGALDAGQFARGRVRGELEGALLSDLPLDARVAICSRVCLCPVPRSW